MTDLAALQAELEAAEAAVAEEASLRRRLASTRELVDDAEHRLTDALVKLGDEQHDVAELESFSPARIWAALRGTRVQDLDREQAEVRAAEYVVAELRTRLRLLESDAASLSDRLASSEAGDRCDRALAAKEAALTAAGGETGAELTRIAAEIGAAETELREVGEAFEAATGAAGALKDTATMLGKARGWAGADTWLGGGLLTDAIKYDRMDQANALLRRADVALSRLAKELGDLGREGVAGPQVSDLTRVFDVWFDNIFSDISVLRRIAEAEDRTARAFHRVADVRRSLFQQREALAEGIAALRARRDELLHR